MRETRTSGLMDSEYGSENKSGRLVRAGRYELSDDPRHESDNYRPKDTHEDLRPVIAG